MSTFGKCLPSLLGVTVCIIVVWMASGGKSDTKIAGPQPGPLPKRAATAEGHARGDVIRDDDFTDSRFPMGRPSRLRDEASSKKGLVHVHRPLSPRTGSSFSKRDPFAVQLPRSWPALMADLDPSDFRLSHIPEGALDQLAAQHPEDFAPPSIEPSPSGSFTGPGSQSDFRFRQLYGQQAWNYHHIQAHHLMGMQHGEE